jgi:hypothetical protein
VIFYSCILLMAHILTFLFSESRCSAILPSISRQLARGHDPSSHAPPICSRRLVRHAPERRRICRRRRQLRPGIGRWAGSATAGRRRCSSSIAGFGRLRPGRGWIWRLPGLKPPFVSCE